MPVPKLVIVVPSKRGTVADPADVIVFGPFPPNVASFVEELLDELGDTFEFSTSRSDFRSFTYPETKEMK